MPTQPAPVRSQLVDEIDALFANRAVSEFNIRRLRHEAEKLKPTDAAGAYMMLGMLDCLDWNAQGMRENHTRVLRLDPHNFMAYLNYVTSLGRMSYLSEAYEHAQDAYKLWPNEPEVIHACIRTAIRAGRITAARGFLSKWAKLQPDKLHKHASFLAAAEKILGAYSLDDDHGECMQETVSSVLRDARVFVLGRNYYAVPEDGGVVNYEMILDLSLDAVTDFNMEVADRVVGRFGGEWPSVIVYSFVPMEDGEQQDERDLQGVSRLS